MARKAAASIDKSFVNGLITQATGLNFPENAAVDTDNCVYSEIGTVSRRLGLDFEDSYTTKTINRDGLAISTYLWKNATGDGLNNFVVLQVGTTLYFYRTDNASGLSPSALSASLSLASLQTATDAGTSVCQFSSGLGYLFVTHAHIKPCSVVYRTATDDFAATETTIQIRDFSVLSDTYRTDEQPAGTNASHNYNLYNQGWVAAKVTAWNTANSTYPSKADLWWYFKNTSEVFTPSTFADRSTGNTLAPRGYFILDAFNQDRNTASGLTTLTSTTSGTERPSTTAFFAGRVFYAGTAYVGYNSTIYFSQIIETIDQVGRCYQNNSPVSEELSELVASDGGTITIPGAGTIYKLVPVGNSLAVFASHGVWTITGSQGIGFTANDYSVNPISTVKSISADSFVDVNGYPSWWNVDGIYILHPDKDGQLIVDSLTDLKIKAFFLDIPFASKQHARGFYNTFSHIVQWMYRSETTSDVTKIYEYDQILNYNTLSGSFYPWSLSTSGVKTHSIVVAETGGSSLISISNVINAATDNVQDAAGNQVVSFGLSSSTTLHTTTKYLVSYNSSGYKFTWAEAKSQNYLDWEAYSTGQDFNSDFTTGFRVHADGQRKFQSNYVYIFSDNAVSTSYDMRALWDFSTAEGTSRWSNAQTTVHNSSNYAYIRRRLKVRGQGQSVQFKFSSISGQPFHIIGWSTYETSPGTI